MYKSKYIILFIIFVCLKSYSKQGNYKFNNFGNKSILLSGNVTGSVEDLGVVYYNPSRLTLIENTGFAFNAKAFQINSIKLSNIDGKENKVRNTDFDGVPGMLGVLLIYLMNDLHSHLYQNLDLMPIKIFNNCPTK